MIDGRRTAACRFWTALVSPAIGIIMHARQVIEIQHGTRDEAFISVIQARYGVMDDKKLQARVNCFHDSSPGAGLPRFRSPEIGLAMIIVCVLPKEALVRGKNAPTQPSSTGTIFIHLRLGLRAMVEVRGGQRAGKGHRRAREPVSGALARGWVL